MIGCEELTDLIEPAAAGELTLDGAATEHVNGCAACAAALDSARRLDAMLRARPVPTAPPYFSSRAMSKIRHARWRSEQYLDLVFNIALGFTAIAVLAAVWIAMRRTGLALIVNDLGQVFETAATSLARRIAPALPVYAAATALLAGALVVWWWAERGGASEMSNRP